MINYEEIANYLLDAMNAIYVYQSSIIYNDITRKTCDIISYKGSINDELIANAKIDRDDYYWSFERAHDRAIEVKRMINYQNIEGFEYFAIPNLLNTKSRIENFLDNCKIEYPPEAHDIYKYDDILNDDKYQGHTDYFNKFHRLHHRLIMINYGLMDEIDHVREAILWSIDIEDKDAQLKILDEIEKLAKQLDGYIEGFD